MAPSVREGRRLPLGLAPALLSQPAAWWVLALALALVLPATRTVWGVGGGLVREAGAVEHTAAFHPPPHPSSTLHDSGGDDPGGRGLEGRMTADAPFTSLVPPPDGVAAYPGERLVFWDDFDTLDLKRWKPEITMGGFGNWEFQVYHNNRSNLFVRNGALHLKATPLGLPEPLIRDGHTLDVWGSDPPSMCTANAFWGCARTSRVDGSILNPVASARVRTAESFSFRYGRVEVRARLPRGDWLWPAIWLLPRHQAYGPWPASGEIDIMESRGNAPSYGGGGRDSFGSTLHVGPYTSANLWPRFHSTYTTRAQAPDLSDDFHTYGLEWGPTGLKTYIDNPGNVVLRVAWTAPGGVYATGAFPPSVDNPWEGSSNLPAAPFDSEFYLIMNVAVGGTNGYWPEGFGKPWSNTEAHPMNSFWRARDAWLPSWAGEGSAMLVDSVRVWQDATGTDGSTASGEWLAYSHALGAASPAFGPPGVPSTSARRQEAGSPAAPASGLGRVLETGDDGESGGRRIRVNLHVNVSREGGGGAGEGGASLALDVGQDGRVTLPLG